MNKYLFRKINHHLFVIMILFSTVSCTALSEHPRKTSYPAMPGERIEEPHSTILGLYENSNWGKCTWVISSLLSYPAIVLLVAPCGEAYGCLTHSEYQWLIRPNLSYMMNPYTRYWSDKLFTEPIYCIVSIPMVSVKYIYDMFFLK